MTSTCITPFGAECRRLRLAHELGHLARLTARFERGQAISEGSGLGLSIAKAIADGTQATLTLHSPAPGRADGFAAVFQAPIGRQPN